MSAEGPAPAGDTGKPTAAKLGLQAGPADVIHLFVRRRPALEAALPALLPARVARGMLWVSWPKKARNSPPGALSEDDLRAVALPMGLVDVKVCAVDATWSGLKLVRRRAPPR